jgi:hypothetical protein
MPKNENTEQQSQMTVAFKIPLYDNGSGKIISYQYHNKQCLKVQTLNCPWERHERVSGSEGKAPYINNVGTR